MSLCRLLPWASIVTMAGKSLTRRCHIASGVPNSNSETPSTASIAAGVELRCAADRVQYTAPDSWSAASVFAPMPPLPITARTPYRRITSAW